MKIAILGTGMVGRALALKLNALEHHVIIGTRDVAKTLSRTEPDGYGNPPFSEWHKGNESINLMTFADAAAMAELIFNCTGGMQSLTALKSAGIENLKGKVLIDVANPLDFSNGMPPTLTPCNTDSLGEQIQHEFPEVKVVKTLNTMNAAIMVNPGMIHGPHHVFLSGNDAEAKKTTSNLLASFGWSAEQIIDLGDISTARGTEMLLPVWLRLWNALGTSAFNFHIQRN